MIMIIIIIIIMIIIITIIMIIIIIIIIILTKRWRSAMAILCVTAPQAVASHSVAAASPLCSTG